MNIKHGRKIESPMRNPKCACGTEGKYDPVWDSYYCPIDGAWLEGKCNDNSCGFCNNYRPSLNDC